MRRGKKKWKKAVNGQKKKKEKKKSQIAIKRTRLEFIVRINSS